MNAYYLQLITFIGVNTLLALGLNPGFLTQAHAGDPVQPPPGLVAFWPGDGNALDVAGTIDGTLASGAGFAADVEGDAV
jgi:hypothetical protein